MTTSSSGSDPSQAATSRQEWNADRLRQIRAALPLRPTLPYEPTTSPSLLPPSLATLQTYTDWGGGWTRIVAGDFARGSQYSGLLFYAQSQGVGEIYSTDGVGGTALLQSHSGWGTSWTQIVPLTVQQSGGTYGSGLLFYDPDAGLGAFYATDGQGNLVLLAEQTGWNDSWTTIVAGHFTGSPSPSPYSDLLFYDQASGAGALYSTDGAGGISHIAEHAWNPGWSDILVQQFRSVGGDNVEGRHDVLFYAGATGYTELYEVLDSGDVNPIASTTLPTGIPFLTPGAFGGSFKSVLTYDRGTGTEPMVTDVNELSETDPAYGPTSKAVFAVGEVFTGWRTTWDLIVPGNFWVVDEGDLLFDEGGFTDLLFYDRAAGYGEIALHEPPDSTNMRPIEGYCSAGSVRPGETLEFFISSQVGPYSLSVYRLAAEDVHMTDVAGLPAAPAPFQINRGAWRDGATWPSVASLQIPLDWPSGVYVGRAQAVGSQVDIPFIVRAATDGSQAVVLAVMNDTTYQAYSHWGGRSLYGFGAHATTISGRALAPATRTCPGRSASRSAGPWTPTSTKLGSSGPIPRSPSPAGWPDRESPSSGARS